jgi:hypothetical protein
MLCDGANFFALYFVILHVISVLFVVAVVVIKVHRHSFLFWVLEMTILGSNKTFSSAEDSGLLISCTLY